MATFTKTPETKSFVKPIAPDPIARSIVAIVAVCSRFPWIVLALAILVTIASGYYTATHFAITTNTNDFISEKLQWRQNLIALDKAFPQRVDQIVVVIDGATPELAEAAAQSLTDRLKRRPDLYQSVMRPEGGPYFNQAALLFQPVADLQRTMQGAFPGQAVSGGARVRSEFARNCKGCFFYKSGGPDESRDAR